MYSCSWKMRTRKKKYIQINQLTRKWNWPLRKHSSELCKNANTTNQICGFFQTSITPCIWHVYANSVTVSSIHLVVNFMYCGEYIHRVYCISSHFSHRCIACCTGIPDLFDLRTRHVSVVIILHVFSFFSLQVNHQDLLAFVSIPNVLVHISTHSCLEFTVTTFVRLFTLKGNILQNIRNTGYV